MLKIQSVKDVLRDYYDLSDLEEVIKIDSGNINHTYLIKINKGDNNLSYILQCLNKKIFTKPDLILHNHILLEQEITKLENITKQKKIIIPKLYSNLDNNFYSKYKGEYWRLMEYVKNSVNFRSASSIDIAYQTGKLLGEFHYYTFQLNSDKFHDIIPNLHNTPLYFSKLKSLESKLKNGILSVEESDKVFEIIRHVYNNESLIDELTRALDEGIISKCIVHGDPKISNFMFEQDTLRSICLIDLDTIQPGLIHHDFGDCVRSCCIITEEDERDLSKIKFDINYLECFLKGYILQGKHFIKKNDIKYLLESIRLIPLELCIRFISDYLIGNKYFQINYKSHNLDRAFVQMSLLNSIDLQWNSIVSIFSSIESQIIYV